MEYIKELERTNKMVRVIKSKHKDRYSFDRKLIYLYFFFLIFEGAFRKWITPGASSLFVVIRDPIVFLLVVRGLKRGWLNNGYCIVSILLSIISFLLSFSLDRTNLIIQYYGTRIFLLYFPAIFVMGRILTLEDVYKLGKYIVYLSIPMTILVILQYFSPQSAWVNRGIGGDMEGSGFGGTMGYYRPSGIFSFTQGLTTFLPIVLIFDLIFFYSKKAREMANISRNWLFPSLICYIICIPASLSRTVLFETVGCIIFFLIAMALTGNRNFRKTLLLVIIILCLLPLLTSIPSIQLFLDVYNNRFEEASTAEGSVIGGTIFNRYFGAFFRAWFISTPFWGHGIGMATPLALQQMSLNFVTDEEWTRIIYESGYLLGTGYILLRVFLTISLFVKSFRKTFRTKDVAPLLFLPCVLFVLPQGSIGNATPLGFMTLLTAMLITLIRSRNENISISSHR